MKLQDGDLPKVVTKATKTPKVAKVARPKAAPRVAVSEPNLRKAAARLLTTSLVSVEVAYLQRELASTVTQDELDQKVIAVRRMPWASIVMPD